LPHRTAFVALYEKLQRMKELVIVPGERSLLDEGFRLYSQRPDKDWSLTDCISFVVMQREGITEALTGDHANCFNKISGSKNPRANPYK
jgi:predicted nucleic acid-binding protein